MSQQFQDWEPVILNKKNKTQENTKRVFSSRDPTKKIDEASDVGDIQRIDGDTRRKIIAMRNEKKMTQAQLAQKLNVDKSVINSYESGSAVLNHNSKLFIQRIFKVLS